MSAWRKGHKPTSLFCNQEICEISILKQKKIKKKKTFHDVDLLMRVEKKGGKPQHF